MSRRPEPPCPHCGAQPNSMYLHLLNTGDMDQCPSHACPVLFAKRRHPSQRGVDQTAAEKLAQMDADERFYALVDGWVS